MDKPLSEEQRDLALLGLCPFCRQPIRGWKPPLGAFAPEMWASIREEGRDPRNGHRTDCPEKGITLR